MQATNIELPPPPTIEPNKPEEQVEEPPKKSLDSSINNHVQIYNDISIKPNMNPIDNNTNNLQMPGSNDLSISLENKKDMSKEVEVAQSEFHFNIDLSIRSGFMLKVYGILLTQFLFTFGIILVCQLNKIKKFLINHIVLYAVLISISAVVFLAAFIVFTCNPNIMKSVPTNYIVLFTITICETILLTYVCILYSFEYIIGAISFVTAICVSIFAISLFNKIDIKFLAMSIVTLCFLLFTYGLLALIVRNYYLHFLYCFIASIIFTLFIVYDTQMIRDHFDVDDYIFAALTLYFDIIRLFIEILKILGSKNRRND